MKTPFTILLILLTTYVFARDRWIANDKFLHFGISMTFTPAAIVIIESRGIHQAEIKGAALMFGVGVSKEFFYDRSPSYKDLTCNALGCVVGIYLNRLLREIDKKLRTKKHGHF
jgi:uncharacterized protein YfiM (DUF2279 family)